MVAVFIGGDLDCPFNPLFRCQSIVFFQIQNQILDVHIRQPVPVPIPAEGLHNIHLIGQ